MAAEALAKVVCPKDRPDVTSAAVSARLCGGRVEVSSAVSETTQTWVNPDGMLTSEQHLAPVRMRQGGAWVPVDATLQRTADGGVAAKAHPGGLRLSGAKTDTGEHEVVTLGSADAAVGVAWTGKLPQPVLDGTKATYPDVLPSVDLVIEATRTGYKQLFVVKDKAGLVSVARIALVLKTGYSSSCGDGWVDINVQPAIQYAATNHSATSTIMLRATSETSNSGWKRFNSSDQTWGDPYVSVTYNALPSVPTSLTIAPCYTTCGGGARVASTHPTLSASLQDANSGQPLQAEFEVRNASTQASVSTSGVLSGSPGWTAGSVASWQVAATLVNGTGYEWRVRADDPAGGGAWTGWTGFTVDTTVPGTPFVSSSLYVSDGQPRGGAGVQGTFTFNPPTGMTDLGAYVYTLTGAGPNPLIPTTTLPATGTATVNITPSVDGNLTLTVRAKDTAGNESTTANVYAFKVGAAALAQPVAGASVARRMKLSVDSAIAEYTRGYFEYRRGAGGVALSILTVPRRVANAYRNAASRPTFLLVERPAGPCG